jgi:hypothetical protein
LPLLLDLSRFGLFNLMSAALIWTVLSWVKRGALLAGSARCRGCMLRTRSVLIAFPHNDLILALWSSTSSNPVSSCFREALRKGFAPTPVPSFAIVLFPVSGVCLKCRRIPAGSGDIAVSSAISEWVECLDKYELFHQRVPIGQSCKTRPQVPLRFEWASFGTVSILRAKSGVITSLLWFVGIECARRFRTRYEQDIEHVHIPVMKSSS